MTASKRPKARQSQLVTTFGVGSIFPAAEESYMICGLDDWDEEWSLPIEEPRLARSLGVHLFRAPASGKTRGDIPVIRFPVMHYCPGCRRLDAFWAFDGRKMRCQDCERDIAPSRFVACCEQGHIEDFPYFGWLHRGQTGEGTSHRMSLRARGASSSLDDIVISCSCGVRPHSMDGSFSQGALAQIKRCGGHRPWLPDAEPEECGSPLRVLQRGSSNVWFAALRSSISIPPWSSPNAQFVSRHWPVLGGMSDTSLRKELPGMIERNPELSVDGVIDIIHDRRGTEAAEPLDDLAIRAEEYDALIVGNAGGSLDTFQCTEVTVASNLTPVIAQVSKVTRLREVRALYGFSRVTPVPTSTTVPKLASLSAAPQTWLPAIEVLGEGIFVRLAESVVRQWEQEALAHQRNESIERSLSVQARESGDPLQPAPPARFVALHSLAHALLLEFSLEAGYPVGSLRERIYAEDEQAGILIYTASSDAAGSLGGLAQLAEPMPFREALLNAISRMGWCSNDPVCSESVPSGADGLNLAACHACLLLPETSCEKRNVYLDRVSLIGSTRSRAGGLLSKLL